MMNLKVCYIFIANNVLVMQFDKWGYDSELKYKDFEDGTEEAI